MCVVALHLEVLQVVASQDQGGDVPQVVTFQGPLARHPGEDGVGQGTVGEVQAEEGAPGRGTGHVDDGGLQDRQALQKL